MSRRSFVGQIADVSDWREAPFDEPMGKREKLWLSEPSATTPPTALMKLERKQGLPEHGSDLWAEVLAAEIGRLVEVPTARAVFATRGTVGRGVLLYRIEGELSHGNELLASVVDDYDRGRTNPLHYNLTTIQDVLATFAGSETGMTAFESFAGYMCFDALIANTDRHHENWAVLKQEQKLAPSYDHGTALGFNAAFDAVDVERFALRGKSVPFGMNLIPLAQDALSRLSDARANLWRDRIASLKRDDLVELVAAVPSEWMSEAARRFVVELVLINQGRLLS